MTCDELAELTLSELRNDSSLKNDVSIPFASQARPSFQV